DGERVTVGPGGSVWLRRGVPHAYQNFTDRDARLLIVTVPGDFCNFFKEVSAVAPPSGSPEPEVFAAIDARYGLTTLGPRMQRCGPRGGACGLPGTSTPAARDPMPRAPTALARTLEATPCIAENSWKSPSPLS